MRPPASCGGGFGCVSGWWLCGHCILSSLLARALLEPPPSHRRASAARPEPSPCMRQAPLLSPVIVLHSILGVVQYR